MLINSKTNVFLGLNNALDPCSYEYREGMAYVSDSSRVDESGLWAEQPALSACNSAPTTQTCPISMEDADSATGFAITSATKTVSKNDAFANYTWVSGDQLQVITSGANSHAVVGFYTIASRTSDDAVVLSTDPTDGTDEAAVTVAFGHVGNHVKNLVVEGVNKIITGIGTSTSVDIGTNGELYAVNGTGYVQGLTNGNITTLAVPALGTVESSGSGGGSYMEVGTYFYICTYYDTIQERESMPSPVKSAEVSSTTDYIAVGLPTGTATKRVRVYRSKVTSAATGRYNPSNIFYFIGEVTTSADIKDQMPDTSQIEYEGRGHAPVVDIDYLISFNNRMLYFKGNTLYWSSAGRPEEVAREYTLNMSGISNASNVKCKPLLSTGVYGDAKFEIAELAGQTVKGGFVKNGKCWLGTEGMLGYLSPTNNLEGYRFTVVREGIGLVNDHVISKTPYGIFGADRQGVWLLDNAGRIIRITDGIVDITDSDKSTYLSQADITNSFGAWLPTLKEYWWGARGKNLCEGGDFSSTVPWDVSDAAWSIVGEGAMYSGADDKDMTHNMTVIAGRSYKITYTINGIMDASITVSIGATAGTTRTTAATFTEILTATDTTKLTFTGTIEGNPLAIIDDVSVYEVGCQIVFQANRGLFAGPYNHNIIGGCNFVSAGGAQAYLNDGSGTGKDGIIPTSPATAQELQFWFGQSSLDTVKDSVRIEVLYNSITANKDITARVYQNKIASTTGATDSGNKTQNDDNLVGAIAPKGSGRMTLVKLVIPSDCAAPIIGVRHSYDPIPYQEKHLR